MRWAWSARSCWALVVAAAAVSCSPEHEAETPSPVSPPPPPTANAAGLTGHDLFQPCLLCHSTREMQRGPILDGLPAWYVENQMRKFRDGIRGSEPENRSAVLMAGAVSPGLSDTDTVLLARHISQLPVRDHLTTVRGDTERGRALYVICAACHGDRAQGNEELKGPPLDVQEDWYLLDQLRKFKAGLRGRHPGDVEGQTMAAVMATLEDAQLRDIVAYITAEFAR